ncbi:hypothetical protein [Populibacterium corticicola]
MLMRRHHKKAEPDTLPVPTKSSSKKEWTAYALASGLSEEDIKGLNKDELIALVQDRVGASDEESPDTTGESLPE